MRNRVSDLPVSRQEYFGYKRDKRSVQAERRKTKIKSKDLTPLSSSLLLDGMRVLLVYSNRARDLILPPPIGLSYVASATRRAGHAVRFVDLLTARDPQTALHSALHDFQPQVVGISVRNIDNVIHQRLHTHFGELAQFIGLIRAATGRQVPIVLGGPAISVLGGRALKHVDADYAVRGEGEITFPALLEALAAGRDPTGIPGVCVRDGDATLADSAPARLHSFGASGMQDWDRLDTLPAARWHLDDPDQARLSDAVQLLHLPGHRGPQVPAAHGNGRGGRNRDRAAYHRTAHLRVRGLHLQPARDACTRHLRGNHPPRVKGKPHHHGHQSARHLGGAVRAHEARRLQLDDDHARGRQRRRAAQSRQGLRHGRRAPYRGSRARQRPA